MQIKFHKRFEKSYKKLPLNLRNKVDSIIEIFLKNPFSPSLRNHALTGKLKDLRAIWIIIADECF